MSLLLRLHTLHQGLQLLFSFPPSVTFANNFKSYWLSSERRQKKSLAALTSTFILKGVSSFEVASASSWAA